MTMSNVHVPDGFWAVLTAVFALLLLLFLLKGMLIGALIAVVAAVWSGFEASGRGPIASRR